MPGQWQFRGRGAQNVLVVLLCLFGLYVWISYNNPETLRLRDQRDRLIEELKSIEQDASLAKKSCQQEVAQIKNSQKNQESQRLRVEIYQAQRKLEECERSRETKSTGINTDAKCDLTTTKSRWTNILNILKEKIQAIKQKIIELKNRVIGKKPKTGGQQFRSAMNDLEEALKES